MFGVKNDSKTMEDLYIFKISDAKRLSKKRNNSFKKVVFFSFCNQKISHNINFLFCRFILLGDLITPKPPRKTRYIIIFALHFFSITV